MIPPPAPTMPIRWAVCPDAEPTRRWGTLPTKPYPRVGTTCYRHGGGLTWHTADALRWYLEGPSGSHVCEWCAVELFLDGKAELADVEGFRVYVEALEALGRACDKTAENPALARDVLDAASTPRDDPGGRWGERARADFLRGMAAVASHPDWSLPGVDRPGAGAQKPGGRKPRTVIAPTPERRSEAS